MQEQDIYGKYGVYLSKILDNLSQRIQEANNRIKQETGLDIQFCLAEP